MEEFNLQPSLEGTLTKLRPLKESDFDELYKVASDPLIWEFHPEKYRYRLENFEKFFKAAITSRGALAAIDTKADKIIGSSRYTGLDQGASKVEIGYTFIDRSYWGKGYNAEVKKLMLNHAFKFISNVYFYAGENNIRSIKALEKLGARLVDRLERKPLEGDRYFAVTYCLNRQSFKYCH